MKTVDEMMGVSSAAGMGAPPPGVDPNSSEAKKFAEPSVKLGKKKKPVLTKSPMTRSALSFKQWMTGDK